MECLDCIETTARLHLYIDRELSDEEIVVVQQHLYGCPRCEDRFHFDLRIKRLIHERCSIERAPASCVKKCCSWLTPQLENASTLIPCWLWRSEQTST